MNLTRFGHTPHHSLKFLPFYISRKFAMDAGNAFLFVIPFIISVFLPFHFHFCFVGFHLKVKRTFTKKHLIPLPNNLLPKP